MSKNERLSQSERMKIITDYQKGTPNPNYDIFESKTQKGRYTIRKKGETGEVKTEVKPEQNVEGPVQEEIVVDAPEYNPFNDDEIFLPKRHLTKAQIFREDQSIINGMFLEQFKTLRELFKHTEKKRRKLGDKTNKMFNILKTLATEEPEEPIIEEPPKEEPKVIEPKQVETKPTVPKKTKFKNLI
jgi:hypothetical protein